MRREWLVKLRAKKKLNQRQIAKLVGISQQFYSVIECGYKGLRPTTAKDIGKVLGFKWTKFYD